MTKFKLKKGDSVIVNSGSEKGKIGTILKMYPKEHKVTVSGVRLVTKSPKKGQQTEMPKNIKVEAPIHISNVSFYDQASKTSGRLSMKIVDGTKKRFLKKADKIID